MISPRLPATPAVLAEWLIAASARYSFELSTVRALGYSSGGDLAVSTMLAHPGALPGAVLFRPRLAARPKLIPQLFGAPVLLVAGSRDEHVALGDSEALGRLLSEAGASVDFAVVESDHGLTPHDFSLAKRWFAEKPA